MSNWKTYLFFTLLALAVLIQVVVLRWGLEAVFFVTWFTLVLTVKHDTRLSPALGLVFLAICPFLLIADKEPVAEQAANYAYFFLAIGVLVQLEELVLERYDRLGWKVDISFLWRPAAEELRRGWTSAGIVPNRAVTNTEQSEPVRWILIVGIVGLALVFLAAAFTGVSLSVLVPLLGGSILFLFFVWVLRLGLLAFGKVRFAQFVWALALLPMVLMAGIWIDDLISAYRMARMELAYNFIDQLDQAKRSFPAPEGETIEAQVWTIGNVPQRVLYQHPAFSGVSRISFPVKIEPGGMLAFELATAPESWEQPGDGVVFTVYVESNEGVLQLFSTYIDPKINETDRRWHPHTIDLSDYAGQEVTIIFETGSGPTGDYHYDWAGWGELKLLVP
jgi:hypothetical protein